MQVYFGAQLGIQSFELVVLPAQLFVLAAELVELGLIGLSFELLAA